MINKEATELLEENVVFYDNVGSGPIAQLPRADYDKLLALVQASEASRKELLVACEKHKKVHIESYGNTSWMANYSDMEVAIKANK